MLPPYEVLRAALRQIITDKAQQGHVVSGLRERVDGLRDSYDAMDQVGRELANLPLRAYISEPMLQKLGRRHTSWSDTVRGRIEYAASDDDINYKVIGMLLLERHGRDFTKDDLRELWYVNLPPGWQFGPERTLNVRG